MQQCARTTIRVRSIRATASSVAATRLFSAAQWETCAQRRHARRSVAVWLCPRIATTKTFAPTIRVIQRPADAYTRSVRATTATHAQAIRARI